MTRSRNNSFEGYEESKVSQNQEQPILSLNSSQSERNYDSEDDLMRVRENREIRQIRLQRPRAQPITEKDAEIVDRITNKR